MQFRTLHVKGFRCFLKAANLSFEPGLTILVGENSTGKSTTALAIAKLFSCVQSGLASGLMEPEDYPFRKIGPVKIEATLELTAQEVQRQLIDPLIPRDVSQALQERLERWLKAKGTIIVISLSQSDHHWLSQVHWGKISIGANLLAQDGVTVGGNGTLWFSVIHRIEDGQTTLETLESAIKDTQMVLDRPPASELMDDLGKFLRETYKATPEFRNRSSPGSSSTVMESWQGSELGSVLFNLRNHPSDQIRKRYEDVKRTFSSLFPRYTIEATHSGPGGGSPEVLFYETGHAQPITLRNISAGVHQVLNWVTNLIGREGLVLFIDHPEEHLHIHSSRFMLRIFREASEKNQVIIATHSPFFVDADAPHAVRKFWWTVEGSRVSEPTLSSLNQRELGQMRTALRSLNNREVVFARCALLVEEESTHAFLRSVAPVLGYDLDADGVSVISVDGDGGYKHFHTLLDGLGIPYVNLRDRAWGHNPKYPPSRFFSLDTGSIENLMDEHGLGELRLQIAREVGDNKVRVAAELARRLEHQQVPEIFDRVLKAAKELATGSPYLEKVEGEEVAQL